MWKSFAVETEKWYVIWFVSSAACVTSATANKDPRRVVDEGWKWNQNWGGWVHEEEGWGWLADWEDRRGASCSGMWGCEVSFSLSLLPGVPGGEGDMSLTLFVSLTQTDIHHKQAGSSLRVPFYVPTIPHACKHKPVSLVSSAAQSFTVSDRVQSTTVAKWLHSSVILNNARMDNGLFVDNSVKEEMLYLY